MEISHLEAHPCPACGKLLDAASSMVDAGRGPEPGNWTVCLYCARVLRFTASMGFVPAGGEEIMRLRKEAPQAFTALVKTILAIRRLWRERAERN